MFLGFLENHLLDFMHKLISIFREKLKNRIIYLIGAKKPILRVIAMIIAWC